MQGVGRTSAMTVVSTVPWWWAAWLRVFWPVGRLIRRFRPPRQQLLSAASVVFAHWSLVERMPPGRPRRASKRFPHRWSYLVFTSNFNGTRDLYLEVFTVAILWTMRALWRGGYGIPDPLPVTRFQEYAAREDITPLHYYCAYPDASTKIIGSALALRGQLDELTERAGALDAEAFAAEYDALLRRNHALL